MEGSQQPTSPGLAGTKIRRLFNDLRTLLERQDEAFIALDRLSTPVDSKDEAEAAYRTAAAQEGRLADAIADTAAALLLAPIERPCDLQFKLMVLIAVSEPHPDDAYIFPGLYLRTLLTDLRSRPLGTRSSFTVLCRRNMNL